MQGLIMAGEWIKVELATPDKPEVLRMARIVGVDKDLIFGKLIRLWSWIDKNSVDGVVDGVVDTDIDSICYLKGFCSALVAVGWIVVDFDNERVIIPKFDRHNGESAKKRALKNEAQAKWRSNKSSNVDTYKSTSESTHSSTSESTREEKRRDIKEIYKEKSEKQKNTSIPSEFSPSEANIKFAQDNHLNLSHEIEQFKNHALANGKKYIDWQAALRTWLGNAKKWDKPTNDKQQPFVMRSI